MRSVLRDVDFNFSGPLSWLLCPCCLGKTWQEQFGLCSFGGVVPAVLSSLGRNPVDGGTQKEVPGSFGFPVNLQCCLKAHSSWEHALEARTALLCAPVAVSNS